MDNLTVIYYTSNREDERFENKIKAKLLETIGDLPLISVSQKSINFGENICVGDVGVSHRNILKQLYTGVVEAKTKFICTAESDFLYPVEYFQFQPDSEEEVFCANNIYVLWNKGWFHSKKPSRSEGAIIVGRDYLIQLIDKMYPEDFWDNKLEEKPEYLFKYSKPVEFHTEIPLVTFKTVNGMHYSSPINKRNTKNELPYWGHSNKLRRKYL